MKVKQSLSLGLTTLLALSGCSGLSDESTTATATAQGFGGEVSVTLTMTDGQLSDVAIVGDHETENVGGQAIIKMQQAMLKQNPSMLKLFLVQPSLPMRL